ncbi:MAG: hypothetical protein F6J95_026490 [Leptolyngbya sp. SIO1E4]|nr:hypothetical protein [Leptolyngbya sp. SIO1E4]
MSHIILWILGFSTLWAGLRLFDDEALLIVSILVGVVLVLAGLLAAPVKLQIAIEVVLIVALFHVCMECVRRGDRA